MTSREISSTNRWNEAKAFLIGPLVAGSAVLANSYKDDVWNAVSSTFNSSAAFLEQTCGRVLSASVSTVQAHPLAIASGTLATTLALFSAMGKAKENQKEEPVSTRLTRAAVITGSSAITSIGLVALTESKNFTNTIKMISSCEQPLRKAITNSDIDLIAIDLVLLVTAIGTVIVTIKALSQIHRFKCQRNSIHFPIRQYA